jgi:3-(3-hydroxy-phenyl)propionate hydroxylase
VSGFQQAEVEDTGQDVHSAWAQVRLPGQAASTRFAARYLVACDGGASPIRKRLGITLEDLEFDEPWLVVDALVHDHKLDQLPQTQVQYCEAARPSTFVVGPGRHRRWEIMLLPGDSLSPDFPEAELWPLLKRWIVPGDATLRRAAAYRFHGLVARDWRQGRILLAGDSAHMTPPFMAQGMVSGLRDAHNLAWKLARVLRQQSAPALLDSYMQERRPHVRQTILASMALGRLICERDPQRALARDAQLRQQHGGVVPTEYRQHLIPPLAHGLIARECALAGGLCPQPRVRAAGFAGRLDDLTGAGLRVVVQGALEQVDRAAYLAALAPLQGGLVEVLACLPPTPPVPAQASARGAAPAWAVVEDTPLLTPWLAAAGQRVAIVRPDHVVYGSAASHVEALHLLNQWKAQLA